MQKQISYVVFFFLCSSLCHASWFSDSIEGFMQFEYSIEPFDKPEVDIDGEKKPFPFHKLSESASTYTHIPLELSSSLNWSGYAAVTSFSHPASHSVSDVSGSWTVPNLTPTPDTSYSACWVGIDGYTSPTVEQIGSIQIWDQGEQQNLIFFEMYPRGAFQIVGFPINPGDVLGAEVSYLGENTFQLSIANYTKHVYTIVPTSYTNHFSAKRNSAEWIIEAPSSVNTVLPLANFGVVPFTNCLATINNRTGAINNSHWKYDPLTMTTQDHVVKAAPSVLIGNGTAFSITWEHE